MNFNKNKLNEIELKIQKYCIYQDRCKEDVIKKLKKRDVKDLEIEKIINQLIKDDFLNEQRFTNAFVLGRFRIKKWGKLKIKYFLIQKKISQDAIDIALSKIKEEDYITTIKKLLESKKRALRTEKNEFKKNAKITNYMKRKGFEPNLVWDIIINQ